MENFNVEIWKDIPGYEGVLQVSNLGRVWKFEEICKRKCHWSGNLINYISKAHFVKTAKYSNGYLFIPIRFKGVKRSSISLHRAVASAFIENPENKPEVNHIDGNKENNNVNNLEWVTHSENHNHMYRVLKYDGANKKNGTPWMCKAINQFDLEGNFIKTFSSISEAYHAVTGKVGNGSISANLRRKTKQAYGYIWRYKE